MTTKPTPNEDPRVAVALARIERAYRERAFELDLSGLGLTKLPDTLMQLSGLRILHLSYNQLTELPEWLIQIERLRLMHIAKNNISYLPEALVQLKHLQVLDLSHNQLTELPEFLGDLLDLKILQLPYNNLSYLPKSLGKLSGLRTLDVAFNKLVQLPRELQKLKSLQDLYLHANPALSLPAEVLGSYRKDANFERHSPNPSSILTYYFRIQEGKRPLNEAKLTLVGRGNVGKTSLVNRLVFNHFNLAEQRTDGINITNWPLKLNKNEEVQMHIWDFGGQEIMHATHQFFLTQRSLYLLVLNGREGGEDADAEYWLKLIESFGGDSPVIIVLNKIKEYPFDLNRRGLQQKYPFIKGYVKTDCEDSTGLEQLRFIIEKETDSLEHLRDPFPAHWFDIKSRLSKSRMNYISFEEFRTVCREEGEEDERAQEELAHYLHNLGILLNYRDDPRLQEMHVLNPHWVTNGIYKILNALKLEQQKGILHLNDTKHILYSKEYPLSMRRFILDLMKKFELCFSFPEDDCCYLIPELLEKDEPLEVTNFDKKDCLQFQYHYPILPEGLLPRFIVRTNVLSDGLPRWRTGTILEFEDNRALVKADVQDKKVYITVTGSTSGRRRLLAIIRSDFERIHKDIQHLNPQEMVPLPNYPEVVLSYQELLVRERKNQYSFSKVVGDDIIDVDVTDILNGIDLKHTRKKDLLMESHSKAVRLFYSYSHKDEILRNELETHLKLLQRQGLISTWHDRQIEAGEEWKHKIDDNLERADIILLLVSSDFIASDYCWDKEMTRALERHEKREAVVVPVVLRDVSWGSAPFAKLQGLPKDALPVTKWPDKDSAWRNVAEGIERVAKSVRQKRGYV